MPESRAVTVPSARQMTAVSELTIKRPIAGWLVEDGPHTFASSPELCDNDVNELLHARPGAKYRIKEKCHDPMPNRVSRRLQEVPSILGLSLERCCRRLPETRRNADQASSRRERQEVVGQERRPLTNLSA